MKYAKKTLALLLALAMLFSMAPASFTASAEEATPKLTFTEPTAEETTPEETTPVETTPKLSFSETLPAEEPTVESPVEDIVVEKNPGKDTETESLLLPQTPTIGDREQSGFRVNPLYEGLVTEDSFPKADFSRFDGEMGVQSDYVNASTAAAQMRQFMKNRVSYYTLYVQTTNSDRWAVFDGIMAEALAHNGVPTEGDSLMWQYGGYNGDSSRYSSGSTYYVTYNIYMPYYTTADQEAALNTAVSNLLAQLNLWNKTDYEKVCGVYDYICDNVTYDYAHLNDPSYDLMFTAYAALVNKTAVCQGYSVLFYRLMLELGVDARVIVGDGGGPHAWNIVELDNLYYNLDSTWDAGQYSYNYFLVSPANFTDHIREPEYDTVEFHAAYPMSPVNYGVSFDPDFIDLYANTLTNVSIYTAGSSVYYRFIPATSGYYALTADSSSDTICNLYNSSWVMLAGDDDSGEGSNFLVEYWLEAGQTYYYEISYYGNTTGSFNILLEETDGSSDSDEIIPLTLDQLTDVTISYGDERVFYSFTPEYDGYYAISSYSNLNTFCFIYDSNGEYKSGADDSGIGANFYKSEYIYAGETYYFEVCLYSETETGSFQICISEAGPTATGKMDNNVGNYYAVSDLVLGSDGTYRTPGGGAVYIAVNNLEEGGLFWLNNYTLYDFVSEYGSNYFDLTYWNSLTNLMDADGYVTLTPDTLNYLIRLITGNSSWGETSDYAPRYFFYDVSGSGEDDDDDEVTVTPLTLNETTVVTITASGASQYYSFTPTESGNYTLTSFSDSDTYCRLYDVDWNELTYDDDSGDGLNFRLEYWLEAGVTYCYEVRYLSSSVTGTFQILLTQGAGSEEEVTAIPLTLNETVTVTITEPGASVLYSFTPGAPGFYTLYSISDTDTLCYLYESGETISVGDDSGIGQNFYVTEIYETDSTLYYEVRFFSDSETGSFDIRMIPAAETASGKMDNVPGNQYALSDLVLGSDGIYRTPTGGTVYIAVNNHEEGGLWYLYNRTLYSIVAENGSEKFDLTYWDELCALADSNGYAVLTETTLEYLSTLVLGNPNWGETPDFLLWYCFYDVVAAEVATLPLTPDVYTDVTIPYGGAHAYYTFTPDTAGYYVLTSHADSDTYCRLYDANWNELSYDDDSGDSLNFRLEYWLEAGVTYYYEVRYLSSSATGTFQILLTHNSEDGTVYPLELDVPTTVTVPQANDTAYYSFTPTQEGYYTLTATANGYYTWCEVYEVSGEAWSLLGGDEGYDFSCMVYLEANHVYYFLVGCGECPDNSTFRILLSYTPDAWMNTLVLNETATVLITSPGTAAYYSFTPVISDYYCLTATSDGGDTYCQLYDADWTFIIDDDDRGDGTDFSLNTYLEAGKTYYFEVFYYSESETGSFRILLTQTGCPSPSGKFENYIYANYQISDLVLGSDGVYRTPEGGTVYVAVSNEVDKGLYYLLGNILATYVEYYGSTMFDLTYWDALCSLTDSQGYAVLTETTLQYLTTLITGNPEWGDTADDVFKYLYYDPAGTHIHVYTESVVAPTCTEEGYTVYTCECGDSYVSDYVGALGHIFIGGECLYCNTEDETFANPTCATGTDVLYARMTALQAAFPEGMPWTNDNWYAWNGGIYSGGFGCAGFAFMLSDAAFGTLPATVIDGPITIDQIRVGDILRINNDTHSVIVLEVYEDRIVIAEGNYNASIHWGRVLTAGTVAQITDYIMTRYPAHSDKATVTAPTCTDQGYTTYVCADCGRTYTDDYVDALGHDYGEWYVTKDATCTEQGEERHDCSRCAHHETRQTAAKGHSLVHHEGQAATCVEHGWEAYDACESCDYTTYVEIPATGHNYTYKMTQEPTLDSTGALTGTCVNCSGTTTVSMPALNLEDYTREILKAPTTESEGTAKYTWKNTEYGVFSVNVTLPMLTDQLMGDVNNDGEVDIFDANLIVAYYNGTANLTDNQLIAADVNGDGEVDIFDANLVVGYYNGTVDKFPAEI